MSDPARFAVGDVVELLTTSGFDGWGRIAEVEFFDADDKDYYTEESWYYRVDGREHWYPEVNIRPLSPLERIAYESREDV